MHRFGSFCKSTLVTIIICIKNTSCSRCKDLRRNGRIYRPNSSALRCSLRAFWRASLSGKHSRLGSFQQSSSEITSIAANASACEKRCGQQNCFRVSILFEALAGRSAVVAKETVLEAVWPRGARRDTHAAGGRLLVGMVPEGSHVLSTGKLSETNG